MPPLGRKTGNEADASRTQEEPACQPTGAFSGLIDWSPQRFYRLKYDWRARTSTDGRSTETLTRRSSGSGEGLLGT